MSEMQYRDFVFPHNPASIEVSHGKNLQAYICPGKGEVLQEVGKAARVVICKGCFFGDTYAQARAQLDAFCAAAEQPGMLYLPEATPFCAWLRDLKWSAEGAGQLLPYTMVFVEVLE
jgi:hypothetical protein